MFDEHSDTDKWIIDSDMKEGLFLITENSMENIESEMEDLT